VIAALLDVTAVGGIDLTTQVSRLRTANSGGGNTDVTNSGNVTVLGMTSTGAGDIRLTNDGAIATTGLIDGEGNVTLMAQSPLTVGAAGITADGSIWLETEDNDGGENSDRLQIDGQVEATGNGTVTLLRRDGAERQRRRRLDRR